MNNTSLSFYSIALTALFTPLLSLAQYDDEEDLISLYDDEELISIATGTEKPIRFSPSVASVISAEDINRSGARNLADVLEGVPGIHVADSLLFDDHLISIRGVHTSNNPQVLVLIDGVEVRHLLTAARPAGFRLPLENVHRIEIIRGPGSAIHGADAFSGVINVITKSGAQISGTNFGGRAGSFDSQDAWVQTGFANNDVEIAFSHEYTRSNGDHDRLIGADGIGASGQFRSEYEIFNTQVKASFHDFRIRLHNWRLTNGGNGAGGAQILDSSGTVNSDYYQFDLGYKAFFTDHWLVDTRIGYNESKTEIENILFPPGVQLGIDGQGNPVGGTNITFPDGLIGNPSADATIIDTDVAFTYSGINNHVFRFATGYKYEDFDTGETKNFGPGVLDLITNPGQVVPIVPADVSNTEFIFVEDVDRESYYFSIQDEWKLADDWELTMGVRFDEYSDVGGTVNPRLALVWAADYNVTAKLLYGRAFRAPSFTELYSQNNPTLLGNESLESETIDTLEAALDFQFSRNLNVNVNIFYYEINDLIDLVASSAGLKAENAIDQEGKGVELAMHWALSEEVSIKSNVSLQDIEDSDTGDSIADVPSAQLFTSLTWKPQKELRFSTELHWIGERERAVMDTREDSDDYALVNITGHQSFLKNKLDVGLIVKNVFDKDAKEPSQLGPLFVSTDFPIEGRSVFLDLRYKIQ